MTSRSSERSEERRGVAAWHASARRRERRENAQEKMNGCMQFCPPSLMGARCGSRAVRIREHACPFMRCGPRIRDQRQHGRCTFSAGTAYRYMYSASLVSNRRWWRWLLRWSGTETVILKSNFFLIVRESKSRLEGKLVLND